MFMYLVVTVSWLYTYLQSYCAEYIKYVDTHTYFSCQKKLNKLLTNNQKILAESEQ